MKSATKIGISALVVVLVGGGLFYVRRVTNGLRNAVSAKYWADRKAGADLYSAQKHMLKGGRHDLKQILLTIDDGPHKTIIPILDALKEKKVPAAFFVVGKNVPACPELVQRMIEDGHEVGNHTYDHLRLPTLTPEKIREQLDKCEKVVEEATGRKMSLMRPPGMDFNDTVIDEVQKRGYTTVYWGVAAKDFIAKVGEGKMTQEIANNVSVSPEQIVERVMKQVKNGSIILLHDNPITAKAIPTIIDKCRAEGYEFVSTKTMLASLPKPIELDANPKVPNWKPKPAQAAAK